jgi:peptide/nickel transport system substrate-binding protein
MKKSPSIYAILIIVTLSIQICFSKLISESVAYQEAPMLAAEVKAGKLPAVDKRLPTSPVVVQPVDKIGDYGGIWRRSYTGLSDLSAIRKVLYDPLVRWTPDFKIAPNLCASWEISNNGAKYIFHLVKGIRWSDGTPFTADDIIFALDDVAFNKELTPSPPNWLAPSGIIPKVTKIDDFSFIMEFDKPYGLFLENLACPHGMALVTKPKRYLSKFHAKYAKPEDIEALLKEKKASSWTKLFNELSSLQQSLFVTTEMPSLLGWITVTPAPSKLFVMERNPYYWKVDTAGNQLPYIDRICSALQAEAGMILLKAVAGEIDFQAQHLGGMSNSVMLLSQQASGKYRLIPKLSTASVGLLLAPNLNHPDPVTRTILSDKRFRIALSHAINRNEINDIVFRGKATPRQAAPLKESDLYDASYESAYLKHDPQLASKMLDEMGLKVGPDGIRLRPDGQPLQMCLDVMASIQTWVDIAEIVASDMKKVKIETAIKSETRELFRQRTQTASHDIALWPGDGGLECLLEPRWYFPFSAESLNAPLYGQWYQTRGKQGEEPPELIRTQMNIFDEIVSSPTHERKKELFSQIIRANQENLWVIGLIYQPPDYYVVSNTMKNVPQKDYQSWIYPNPGPVHPEQFFFDKTR